MGGGDHGVGAQRLVLGQQPTQRVIHRRLAVAGRVLQDSQVLAGAHGRRVLRAQPIVGLAKAAVGEQILAIPIILKGARLAHQLVDDVPIVDGVLVASHQPWQGVHATSRVPDFHAVRVQPGFDLLANQPAVHRVRVTMDVNQASRVHTHRQTQAALQALVGKRPEQRQLFGVTLAASCVALVQQFAQERQVILAAGEVPTATQQQGLIHRSLEVTVRRLRVAVLVRLTHIDPLARHTVMVQQGLIPSPKLALLGEVVDRRAETVTPMPSGHSSQFPEGVLQAVRQRLEGLRRTQRHRFPVRIREHEMIRQVLESLADDRDSQRVHLREVGSGQIARMMHLTEHHFPSRTAGHPPMSDASFQGPAVTGLELPGLLLLKPIENRLGLKPRFLLQEGLHLGPNLGERVLPRPVRARLPERARQLPRVAVLACRLLVHPSPPGRHGQLPSTVQISPQLPYLSILDHRNPP